MHPDPPTPPYGLASPSSSLKDTWPLPTRLLDPDPNPSAAHSPLLPISSPKGS